MFPSTRGRGTRRKIHRERKELIAEECDYCDTARLRTGTEKASLTRLAIRLCEPDFNAILAAGALVPAAMHASIAGSATDSSR